MVTKMVWELRLRFKGFSRASSNFSEPCSRPLVALQLVTYKAKIEPRRSKPNSQLGRG